MGRKRKDHGQPLLDAAFNMDWGQVVANGGPPCFHAEEGKFCGRTPHWQGHPKMHEFISLFDLLCIVYDRTKLEARHEINSVRKKPSSRNRKR